MGVKALRPFGYVNARQSAGADGTCRLGIDLQAEPHGAHVLLQAREQPIRVDIEQRRKLVGGADRVFDLDGHRVHRFGADAGGEWHHIAVVDRAAVGQKRHGAKPLGQRHVEETVAVP